MALTETTMATTNDSPKSPDRICLERVQAVLDRKEWNPDCLDEIAEILRAHGIPVRDWEPVTSFDPRD